MRVYLTRRARLDVGGCGVELAPMIELRNDHLTVTCRERGAELTSLRDTNGREYLWQADPDVWPRHAPILFPIVGRLAGDRYEHDGRDYTMGQHGFARDRDFAVSQREDNSVSFVLVADDDTRAIYPFEFRLRVTYTLDAAAVRVQIDVTNAGDPPLLYSLGAHPGLRCPLADDESFEDYEVRFDRILQATRQPLSGGLRAGVTQPYIDDEDSLQLLPMLFDNDALVLAGQLPRRAELRHITRGHGVALTTLEPEEWPYYGIWSKPDASGVHRFVCLEPWCGVASRADRGPELANKEGIMTLASGDTRTFAYALEVLP